MDDLHARRVLPLDQENFESVLNWLGSDIESAGRKYEDIRSRLMRFFACRGCVDAEDLADETINRVAYRIKEIRDSYVGDPAMYFYGVARTVHRYYIRRPIRVPATEAHEPLKSTDEITYQCLEKCLQNLSADKRELILQYHKEEKEAKIVARRVLAAQLGLGVNALRIRAHRIRVALQRCVAECLENETSGLS